MVPVEALKRHEEGPAGIGDVGDVLLPVRQLPHQPRVHRAKQSITPGWRFIVSGVRGVDVGEFNKTCKTKKAVDAYVRRGYVSTWYISITLRRV